MVKPYPTKKYKKYMYSISHIRLISSLLNSLIVDSIDINRQISQCQSQNTLIILN